MNLIVFNANILTQDVTRPRAQSMYVVNGRIQALGSSEEILTLATADSNKVDAEGCTIIPGLNDAHVHTWKVGHLKAGMLDVRGVPGIEELKAQIGHFAHGLLEGKWFQGRGYNEATLREHRHPNRHDLDEVLGDRPGLLIRTCAHIAVANSAALRIAGITRNSPDPSGGLIERDNDGELTGILHETALGLVMGVMPPPSRADYEDMILTGSLHQLSLGITSATDPAVTPELIEAYRSLETEGRLPQRMNLLAIRRPDGGDETYPLPEKWVSDFLRIDGVKFFADGGLSGATAALSRPYKGLTTQGVLRFQTEELYTLALEAHNAGFRIGTHAIGDVAISQVLDVYTRLEAQGHGQRHRIEHLGLPTAEHLKRIAQHRWIAVPQTIFIEELGPNFRRYLEDDYLTRAYPIHSMLDAGITVALSSDAPVVRNDNPFSGMKAALTRKDREGHCIAGNQAISLREALWCYTMGGAIASGEESNRGSLSIGKHADFVILSENPMEIAPEELDQIKVLSTWISGVEVYSV